MHGGTVGQVDRDRVADFDSELMGCLGTEDRAIGAEFSFDDVDRFVACGVVAVDADDLRRSGGGGVATRQRGRTEVGQ